MKIKAAITLLRLRTPAPPKETLNSDRKGSKTALGVGPSFGPHLCTEPWGGPMPGTGLAKVRGLLWEISIASNSCLMIQQLLWRVFLILSWKLFPEASLHRSWLCLGLHITSTPAPGSSSEMGYGNCRPWFCSPPGWPAISQEVHPTHLVTVDRTYKVAPLAGVGVDESRALGLDPLTHLSLCLHKLSQF